MEYGGEREDQERAGAGADETVVEADAQAREADRREDLAAGGRAGAGAVPKAGRRMTKVATASSTTMITGLSTSVLMPAAKKAPVELPARAARPMRTARPTFTGALRAYVTAAPDVPTIATALLVPSAVAAGVPAGRPRRSTGSRRSPPPPTTASIQPVARAVRQRTATMVSGMSGMIMTLWTGCVWRPCM